MSSLNIDNLTKIYPNGVKALDNITLAIKPGLFGLLGPNGAGKSTLLSILATLQDVTSGSIMFNSINVLEEPNEMRKRLGYLPQEFGVYPHISAISLLDHIAVLKGFNNKSERREIVKFLLEKVNLYEFKDSEVKLFSGGMKKRFGIAQAIMGEPELIIVDEPTSGLDPEERNRFYNLLSDMGENAVVILSTHIVEDIYELCTDMAIIKSGNILFKGNPENAISNLGNNVWEIRTHRSSVDEIRRHHTILSCKYVAGMANLHVLSEKFPGPSFKRVSPNLEDAYFTKINL